MIPFFLPPLRQVFMLEHVITGIVRERVYIAMVPERIGALKSLLVSRFELHMAGEYFIHGAMPLGRLAELDSKEICHLLSVPGRTGT